ncbi:hypothetical protein [Spongiimicrobium salis]|uniref:hypothetical protein n=1 Tax=Spongiimicrobium salis TaxID=1667022 RepID=UPI00374D9228
MKNVVLLSLILLCSCGSRKRTVGKSEKIKVERKDISFVHNKDIISNVRVNKVLNKVTYEPLDVDTPIIINNDTIRNARITLETKEIDSTSSTVDKGIIKAEDKSNFTSSEKTKDTKTESEGFNFKGFNWMLWIILLIAIVIASVRLIPYFKKKH